MRTFEDVIQEEHPWTAADIGKNAISVFKLTQGIMLEQSIKRKESLVTNIPIRRVKLNEFDPYLKSLGSAIDKYQLNKFSGTQGTPVLGEGLDMLEHDFQKFNFTIQKYLHAAILPNSFKDLSKEERSTTDPLKQIAPVFSKLDFDLKNPDYFTEIIECKDIVGVSSPEPVLANNALQIKLLAMANLAENQLLKEIAIRSASFFEALGQLDSVLLETQNCISKLQGLRSSLQSLSSTLKKPLEIISIMRRRGNLAVMHNLIKIFKDLEDCKPIISDLLSQGDYLGAIELIENSCLALTGNTVPKILDDIPFNENVAKGITYNSTSLTEVNVKDILILNNVKEWVTNTMSIMEKNAKKEFAEIFCDYLNLNDFIMTSEDITRFTGKELSSQHEIKHPLISDLFDQNPACESLKARLSPLVRGLLRMDRLSSALNHSKNAAIKVMKVKSNQLYPVPSVERTTTLTAKEISDLKLSRQQYGSINVGSWQRKSEV
jgi:hypothetical protein